MWHRVITIPAKSNFYFQFTIESYDNMGIVSTLNKADGRVTLDCQTPLSNARFFNAAVNAILDTVKREDGKQF